MLQPALVRNVCNLCLTLFCLMSIKRSHILKQTCRQCVTFQWTSGTKGLSFILNSLSGQQFFNVYFSTFTVSLSDFWDWEPLSLLFLKLYRTSRPEIIWGKGFKKFAKFTGKHMCWSIFSIQLQAFSVQLYWRIAFNTCISCEFYEMFKNIIFTEQLQSKKEPRVGNIR